MAMNFPNSPTNGQQFTAGSTTWQWDSTAGVWTVVKPLVMPDAPADNKSYGRRNNAWVDVGEELIGYQKLSSDAASINFTFSSAPYVNLRAVGKLSAATGGGYMTARLTKDGGTTWLQGTTDYIAAWGYFAGDGYAAGGGTGNYIYVTSLSVLTTPVQTILEFTAVNENGPTYNRMASNYNNGSAIIIDNSNGYTNTVASNGVHNGIQFLTTVGNLAAGSYVFLYGQRG